MATVAITQRSHAQHNRDVYFYGTPLMREDYLNSLMVAYPFCLFDCDISRCRGAVAFVLTTPDRAHDVKPAPAYLAGYGQCSTSRWRLPLFDAVLRHRAASG
jgi:hypothetical protein